MTNFISDCGWQMEIGKFVEFVGENCIYLQYLNERGDDIGRTL